MIMIDAILGAINAADGKVERIGAKELDNIGVLGFGDHPWSLVCARYPNTDGMHPHGHMKVVA